MENNGVGFADLCKSIATGNPLIVNCQLPIVHSTS